MITVFYGALLASAYLFAQVDATAGLLMVPTCVEINTSEFGYNVASMAWGACNLICTQVPTCLWVTIAAALNWSIYFRLGGATSSD